MSRMYLNAKNLDFGTSEFYIAKKQIFKRNGQVYEASKRANKIGVINSFTLKEWINVLIESEGKCFYCKVLVGYENLGIDHVIPMCKGGENSIKNIVASCIHCNCQKQAKFPSELIIEKFLAHQANDKPSGGDIESKPAARDCFD